LSVGSLQPMLWAWRVSSSPQLCSRCHRLPGICPGDDRPCRPHRDRPRRVGAVGSARSGPVCRRLSDGGLLRHAPL